VIAFCPVFLLLEIVFVLTQSVARIQQGIIREGNRRWVADPEINTSDGIARRLGGNLMLTDNVQIPTGFCSVPDGTYLLDIGQLNFRRRVVLTENKVVSLLMRAAFAQSKFVVFCVVSNSALFPRNR
jgi:hypothetical protein